ncbi:MAG: F0F1 ATP synthase subunit epsilon [Oscillospiraceae bacterium]|nr:F0F1 ATP synthase subunit epsilon [Oscillospiraceae bacterium]
MADRIRLKIVTPAGTALDRMTNYVNLPTPEGSVGILADHAPMLCALGKGRLKYRFEGGESFLSVSGGVAGVGNNELTVLAEEVRNEE